MKKNNFKIAIVVSLVSVIGSQAKSENITGTISKGNSSIQYTVDTSSGEYSLNLKNAFNPKIILASKELENLSCGKEAAIVKGSHGELPIHYYKRNPISIGFSISDLGQNLTEIEKRIQDDVAHKNARIPNLKRITKFFIDSPSLGFEWNVKALAVKAKSQITALIQERFQKFLSDESTFSNLSNLNEAYLEMPIHLIVCDLIEKDLIIDWNSTVGVQNSVKKDPPLSRNQISNLNNYLLSNSNKLKTTSNDLDADTKKIVNSSALLAFGLAQQGVDLNYISLKNFESLFFKMFGFPSRFPKKLSDSDIGEVQNMITDHVSTDTQSINLSNKQMKVVVLK